MQQEIVDVVVVVLAIDKEMFEERKMHDAACTQISIGRRKRDHVSKVGQLRKHKQREFQGKFAEGVGHDERLIEGRGNCVGIIVMYSTQHDAADKRLPKSRHTPDRIDQPDGAAQSPKPVSDV